MVLLLVVGFWVLVVAAVAATVFAMAVLNAWGDPQPVRSLLDDVGLLGDVTVPEYRGAHRGWSS